MRALVLGLLVQLGTALPALAAARDDDAFAALGAEYGEQTRPLLKQFCLDCHATAEPAGELDLERFATLADARGGTKAWLKAAEMLDLGEMPPKDAPQPSADERKALRDWIARYLDAEALASAGDPGPVVLRRLSNAEYTYTVRDLTGVNLSPAREFPADSAAGEGFTNAGAALVMSPALLTKYFDAGKEIARHAVLLPDGVRFSPSQTRSDWTNDILARIRQLYADHTTAQGGTQVNLQGIVFDTNAGGRLPLEDYLAATLAEREALAAGTKSIETIARERGLSPKYLASLWRLLNEPDGSPLLESVRRRWREAKPGDAATVAAEIAPWQNALTRFQSVGHMKPWMVPVDPLTSRQELRYGIPAADGDDVVFYFVASEAGDGADHDVVVWERPRLVAPGRPDLLLRDVRGFTRVMTARRGVLLQSTAACLAAVAEAAAAPDELTVEELARRHAVDADALAAWMSYLGVGPTAMQHLDHYTGQITQSGGYDFVQGWGSHDTPLLIANSSDREVRVPGNMRPGGVAVHPSPTLRAAVGWRSPVTAEVRIEGHVAHAHPGCGNGVEWTLELRRGATRQRLAAGVSAGGASVPFGPIESLAVQTGDLIALSVGPRDVNHACDLTDIELAISSGGEWRLTADVAGDVRAGNPHADRQGNADVWHFYTEAVDAAGGPDVPAGSVLARWQLAQTDEERKREAIALQELLTGEPPADPAHPDAVLHRQLTSLGGRLLAAQWQAFSRSDAADAGPTAGDGVGVDPALFGRHSDGTPIDADSLCVQAPSVVEIRLPADLAAGAELVATGTLHAPSGAEGSVQLAVLAAPPPSLETLRTNVPILVDESGETRERFERACDDFRNWFPAALCYTKIVPVDEVVTLTLFHREDENLSRLMLDEAQAAQLDRLWEELHFVSHDALTLVDAFAQLMEYATQDSDPGLFEPYRVPIHDRAAAFRQALVDAEPRHVEAVLEIAGRAYRRPLTEQEAEQLRGLYQRLREQELPHDEALRFTLARVFVAPAFLYRLEKAPPGEAAGPVSDWELATRLSYFLWSSLPDSELREAAEARRLGDPDVLAAQARRMLADGRTRRLATEFACQWLHIYEFDALDEKSPQSFPTFGDVRDDMYEESIRFFTDLFASDASILSAFDADHTFVNAALAEHYGIPDVAGDEWRRVEGVRRYGRGGILGLSATLAKQSGASRTSPILRGNWISEVLLGEKLPRPPKDVPPLADDEAGQELTVRELTERHTSDARCASCHRRIDPYGFALEGFDAIGRRREQDLTGHKIDTHATLPDGTEVEGLDGLRTYLTTVQREALLRQFCRKLLGYALGRGVQLSDEPLLDEMLARLQREEYRFSTAVDTIVRSPQFREIRGQDAQFAEAD